MKVSAPDGLMKRRTARLVCRIKQPARQDKFILLPGQLCAVRSQNGERDRVGRDVPSHNTRGTNTRLEKLRRRLARFRSSAARRCTETMNFRTASKVMLFEQRKECPTVLVGEFRGMSDVTAMPGHCIVEVVPFEGNDHT